MYELVIGNKNYSSWSLRAWLHLRESGIDFKETRVPLFEGDWRQRLARYSPAGRVPVLVDQDLRIWDTMSIFEYLLEQEADAVGWPRDPAARARARSVTAEMHSGFLAVREYLPQNVRARDPIDPHTYSQDLQGQLARIQQIWATCYEDSGGPWLFGAFSLADVMYAPVALRFVTYDVALEGHSRDFVEAIQSLESVVEWVRDSAAESESIDFVDARLGTDGVPMSLG